MQLIFATHNKNKLIEVKRLIPSTIELLSLDDILLPSKFIKGVLFAYNG
jgi:inosine/xanthosine triphosphate pyrophosphatase family protein